MKSSEITSSKNDLIKFVVKLQDTKFRKSQKLILVDGAQTIEGFTKDKIEFEYLFLKKSNELYKKINAKEVCFITDEILKKISTTKSPTEVVGIIKEPYVDEKLFFNMKKIALIDGIKDAGNLGTIIRSAAAFSIDGIILYNNCVDLYNSKTIRATTQNIFTIPIIRTSDINFLKELKRNHKFVSTVVDGDNDFMNYGFDENFIIAFGSEADGISQEIIDISDEKITLDMDNNVESLNLGVCASIAFAFIKQKIKSK